MTETLLATLLPAMDLVVFSHGTDGSFVSIAPPPPWFRRIADVTFPFLGHILEEATDFWRSGVPGSREYGPCVEVDEAGREFHYRVKALTIGEFGSQFLVFELDPGSDRLRDALQKARDQALVLERNRAAQLAAAGNVRLAGLEIQKLLKQLPAGAGLAGALRAKCEVLMQAAKTITG
jgi:hypothetical protein